MGPLVQPSPRLPSHAAPCGTLLPEARPEDGQQIPARFPAPVRTRLMQVPATLTLQTMRGEPGGKHGRGDAGSIPPAVERAGAAMAAG